VYNILGKQIAFFQNINANEFTIKVLDWSQGLYLLKINNAKIIKFVVE
jgi:hypothetical protein